MAKMTPEPLCCEFALLDDVGNDRWACERTDYEEVTMPDEGAVRLCPKHRSWAPAMGRRQS